MSRKNAGLAAFAIILFILYLTKESMFAICIIFPLAVTYFNYKYFGIYNFISNIIMEIQHRYNPIEN